MELIRTIRERHKASRRADVVNRANDVITLDDFDGSVYVAFNGVPFVHIDDTLTAKDIVKKLDELRENYINAVTKELGISKPSST